ncbi:hypothetical protein COOONC_21468 [Cooperia oncophora]
MYQFLSKGFRFCTPVEVDRFLPDLFDKWREMQQDPRYVRTGCRDVYMEMLNAFDDETLGDAEEREKMRLVFMKASGATGNRRSPIAQPTEQDDHEEAAPTEQDDYEEAVRLPSSSYLEHLVKQETDKT